MKLVKCENGHFFDSERYSACPHCEQSRGSDVTTPLVRGTIHGDVTMALDQGGSQVTEAIGATEASVPLKDAVKAAFANVEPETSEKTVGFFSGAIGIEPVVGWLVCTEGEHFGEDFKLKSGRNFIGRSANMDIAIIKDGTVSREKHTAIVYEPRANLFLIQPGDSKELSYLNGEVVLTAMQIKAHDRLTVGKTELMFIPCCGELFKWEIEDKKNDENAKK